MKARDFSARMLNELVGNASATQRGRLHQNIHQSYADACQRLFNAIGVDSYIRPHRHRMAHRDECLIAVRGLMALVIFEDNGYITEAVPFGVQSPDVMEGLSVGVEIPASLWHTVVALRPGSILFEVKAGPFDPAQAKEFAVWAPEEGTEAARDYLLSLKETAALTASLWI